MTEQDKTSAFVEVHVTFASAATPYNHKYATTETLAHVLTDALARWGIQTDGTTRYYFQFAGTEQDGGVTVGALAEQGPGHSHALKLSLRTETISG